MTPAVAEPPLPGGATFDALDPVWPRRCPNSPPPPLFASSQKPPAFPFDIPAPVAELGADPVAKPNVP